MLLADMLAKDRDALICDMAESYGVFDRWALPVTLLATLAAGLRDNSRIMMKRAGLTYIPPEFVLPQIRDQLAVIFRDGKQDQEPLLLMDIMTGKASAHKKQAGVFGRDGIEEYERIRKRILEGQ